MQIDRSSWIAGALLSLTSLVCSAGERPYVLTPLGTLAGYTYAQDVNALDQVVGYGATSPPFGGGITSAILWQGVAPTLLSPASSLALSINNSGTAAGALQIPVAQGTNYQAVVWKDGTQQILPPIGGTSAYAWGINSAGHVVGWSDIDNSQTHVAVMWKNSQPSVLGQLEGARSSWAFNLSDSGQVVGQTLLASGTHATIWNGLVPTDLGTLGGANSSANAVNAAGQVVGWTEMAATGTALPAAGGPPQPPAPLRHAFWWNGAQLSDLSPTAVYSDAADINGIGQIVGRIDGRATLWEAGVATDLNSLLSADDIAAGWTLAYAAAISDDGAIVGGASRGGTVQPFLLTPVPELPSYAMFVVGLCALAAARTRAGRRRLG